MWSHLRILDELLRKRGRRGQAAIRDLTGENGLHHRTQSCCFFSLSVLLRAIRELVEHGTADRRTNPVAANDEVARRSRPISEVERDGLGRRRFGVRGKAFREMDPIEMIGEQLLQDRPVECVD